MCTTIKQTEEGQDDSLNCVSVRVYIFCFSDNITMYNRSINNTRQLSLYDYKLLV